MDKSSETMGRPKEWYRKEYRAIACGIYRHYKGGLYLVLGLGQHSENEELVVVYVALTGANLPGPRLRVRPLNLFTDQVNGQPRFLYIGHDAAEVAQ